MRAEFGRLGLRRSRRHGESDGSPAARARPLVFVTLLLLVFADAGLAAPGPDPHPSATAPAPKSAPAPDRYPAPVAETPSEQPAAPVYESEPVTQVETTPTIVSVPRTQSPKPKPASTSRKRVQPTTDAKPEPKQKVTAPQQAPRREQARIEISTAEGRPLLFGGLALVVLSLASGSLLFLVTRAGRLELRS